MHDLDQDIRKSDDPKNKEVSSEHGINQVLWEKLEQQKKREKHSTPNQWETHSMLFRHRLLQSFQTNNLDQIRKRVSLKTDLLTVGGESFTERKQPT